MERTIGNLGEEIRQHKDAFANLSQRAIHRCRINALMCLMPELDIAVLAEKATSIPNKGRDAGHGYYLLPAADRYFQNLKGSELVALNTYICRAGVPSARDTPRRIRRWARLYLPNKQVAKSEWKEDQRMGPVRRSRNVLVCHLPLTCPS